MSDHITNLTNELHDATTLIASLSKALDQTLTLIPADHAEMPVWKDLLQEAAEHLGFIPGNAEDVPITVSVRVTVTGEPTDSEDDEVPGVYDLLAHLSRPIDIANLKPNEAGAIAQAVLDTFHGNVAIGCLDDFTITVTTDDGIALEEMAQADDHDDELVIHASYEGRAAGPEKSPPQG